MCSSRLLKRSFCTIFLCVMSSGCTVKAVGDPERPITIRAHITVDIKELKSTATDIEDFVSGKKDEKALPLEEKKGGQNE